MWLRGDIALDERGFIRTGVIDGDGSPEPILSP